MYYAGIDEHLKYVTLAVLDRFATCHVQDSLRHLDAHNLRRSHRPPRNHSSSLDLAACGLSGPDHLFEFSTRHDRRRPRQHPVSWTLGGTDCRRLKLARNLRENRYTRRQVHGRRCSKSQLAKLGEAYAASHELWPVPGSSEYFT